MASAVPGAVNLRALTCMRTSATAVTMFSEGIRTATVRCCSTLRDKIYTVRGVKVLLDFELAEIYGYTTSAFNQQVKNNIAKFDDDFRFQLSHEELEQLSMSKNLISIQTAESHDAGVLLVSGCRREG